MEQKEKKFSIWSEVEPYCVLRMIWKNLWMVLMAAALFLMLAYLVMTLFVKPTYSCTTTFAVTQKYKSGNYSPGSASIASGTAEQFASLLTSPTLMNRVRQQTGIDTAGTTVRARAVEDTNLITMTVSSQSPKKAYDMTSGILNHYTDYSQYIFDSVVLEPVSMPGVPTDAGYAATKRRVLMVSAPLGALLMVALLAFVTIISGTVQTPTGARNQVDGTLLSVISHERKHRTFKGWLLRKKTSLLISNPTTAFLYVETIHQLRARLEHAKRHHRCKTFLITSVGENEGKSTVAANLALSLAKKHQKVLLIDCDLRSIWSLSSSPTPPRRSTPCSRAAWSPRDLSGRCNTARQTTSSVSTAAASAATRASCSPPGR